MTGGNKGSRSSPGLNHILGALFLVSIILIFSVYFGIPPFDHPQKVDDVGTSTEESHNALQEASIKFSPPPLDEYSFNESHPVTLETTVDIEVRGYPPFRYEGARLCFYSEDGSRIGGSDIGPIVSKDDGEFRRYITRNVSLEQSPEYVVVDHPKLRNDSRFRMRVREWSEERNVWTLDYGTLDEIQDRFQWPRTEEVGKCG